jgi:RNA polymerase sigma factor (sigma-70 family)
MSLNRAPQPLLPAEEEQALHRRLCEGDPLAPPDLCRIYFEPLLAWLRAIHGRRGQGLDESLLSTAAEDAVIGLIKNPQAYDPTRRDLFGYLRMAAEGDLKNEYRKEQRHHRGRKPWIVVENEEAAGNCSGPGREPDPAELLEQAEQLQATQEWLGRISASWTEEERQVLDLMRQGEKRTEVVARVLGLEELPFGEQQEAVNRVKDRIKLRLKREVKRHE